MSLLTALCNSALPESPLVSVTPFPLGLSSPAPTPRSTISHPRSTQGTASSSLGPRAEDASRRAARTAAVAVPSSSSGSCSPDTEPSLAAAPCYLKDMSKEELQEWVSHTLGEDPKRAHTLWKWLYRNHHWAAGPDDMEGVSAAFRRRLRDSRVCFDSLQHVGTHESSDGTKKVLFQLRDGTNGGHALIETVLIPHSSRSGKPVKPSPQFQAEPHSPPTPRHTNTAHSLNRDDDPDLVGRHSAEDSLAPGDTAVPAWGTLPSVKSIQSTSGFQERGDSQGGNGMASSPGLESRGGSPSGDASHCSASTPEAGPGASGIPGSASTRYTICVSSQLGCAMNCQFCFTAKMGLRQNLTPGQIVDQVVQVRRLFTKELGQISNVVFMGMGEPLHNLENVIRAVNTLTDVYGLHCSPHRTTVSTCGLVPEIREYRRRTQGSLALSLHATTDEVRDRLMPINRRYNIGQLMDCLTQEFGQGPKGKSHVLVEYLLLDGVNDSKEDALRLSDLTSTFPCKVNLIMFNRFPGAPFAPTSEAKAQEFQDTLKANGVKAFLRLSRGDDAMAACGQLGSPGLK